MTDSEIAGAASLTIQAGGATGLCLAICGLAPSQVLAGAIAATSLTFVAFACLIVTDTKAGSDKR